MLGCGGVVLAGGRSSRMGTPKAALEWHGSTLLCRTVWILARAGAGMPVVVVRAAGQPLPRLPAWAEVTDDPREGLGPLQGIAAGLAAVAGRAEAAFVCSTDLPFLHPAFVRAVTGAISPGIDVALPVARGFPQPLAAAYRTLLAPLADQLAAGGLRRPADLFARSAVKRLDEAALLASPVLAAADPALDSLLNVNDREQYATARARPAPEVTIEFAGEFAAGRPAGPPRRRPGQPDRWPDRQLVRAATLGQAAAAAAAGVSVRDDLRAEIDGFSPAPYGWADEFPLIAGDRVVFRAGSGL